MLKLFKVLTVAGPLITLLAGCGVPDGQTSSLNADETLVTLAPLQATQLESPDSGCLRAVNARFIANVDGTLAQVSLDNVVTEPCEILIPKEHRTFNLSRKGEECGSKLYSATGSEGRSILIADHSERTCEDLRPYLIEIREVDPSAHAVRYGGNWN